MLTPAIAQTTGVNKSVSFARWQQGAGFVVPRTAACYYCNAYAVYDQTSELLHLILRLKETASFDMAPQRRGLLLTFFLILFSTTRRDPAVRRCNISAVRSDRQPDNWISCRYHYRCTSACIFPDVMHTVSSRLSTIVQRPSISSSPEINFSSATVRGRTQPPV